MSEWPMVKLGELGKWAAGGTPSRLKAEYFGGIIPWASIADLNDGFVSMTMESITELGLQNSSAKIYPKGSILIAMYGSIGKLGINVVPMASNQAIACFIPNETLERDYAFWALYSLRSELIMIGRGGTQKNIGQGILKEQKIPLPPLGEQKRIAEILGRTSQAIKATENIIHKVQGLKRSVLRDILNNKSGEYVQLSQISSVQSGITKGRKVQNEITLMPTPYMAVSNVKAGYLDLSEVKQIDASEAEVNRYQLQAGDILLTEGGDPDKLGRGTIWRNEIPGAIHQNHIFRVRINPDSGFTSEALMAILESTESKGYFLRSAKQTTGISSINKRQLSATPIPVLGKVQIEELTNMWHKIDEVIELYHRKLSLLQELQKSLANRAFAGLL